MRKKVSLLLIIAIAVSLLPAATNAGRSLASKYLNLAINAISSDDYENADSLALTGISYDETVADFWYIRAKAAEGRNASSKEIISFLEKAAELTDWLKFSRTNSVLMLADLYYKTGLYEPCLELLLTISDLALPEYYYLEAAACYAVGNLQLARSVISLATSIYPDKAEYLSLFFKNEFEICDKAGSSLPYKETPAGDISKALLKRVTSLYEQSPDILLYGSFFVEEEEALAFMKLYSAETDLYGFDIFYPYAALMCGYLTEKEALEAYVKIADRVFDYGMLSRMASVIKTEEGLSSFQSFLYDFDDKILFSSANNSVYDLSCLYSYGRPLEISYDRNCDGSVEWHMECDYGTPISLLNYEEAFSLKYYSFPYLKNLDFSNTGFSYSFVPYSQEWTPVLIEKASFSPEENPFFIPVLPEEEALLAENDFLKNANSFSFPMDYNSGLTASFSIFDEIPLKATYFEDGEEIAQAFFSEGVLSSRAVDMDRDGQKEVLEIYSIPEEAKNEEAQKELYESLFGRMPYKYDIWLSELFIDTDGDSAYDYRTVYSEDGWTHTFWGIDGRGYYEASYSENADKSLRETQFFNPLEKNLVTAVFRDDRLLTVTVGEEIYSVYYDAENDFYWVYEKSDVGSIIPDIKAMLDDKGNGLNATVIKQLDDNKKVLACKTCGVYFGVMIYE